MSLYACLVGIGFTLPAWIPGFEPAETARIAVDV
jgi:hypothetical protein